MATAQQIYKFRSQFNEFSGNNVADPDIALSIDTASLWIDQNLWSANDYPLAILYWAAHFLTLKQMQLASVQLGGTGTTDLFIRNITFGERSVGFQQRQGAKSSEALAGPGEELLNETIYGQLYLMLRTRNVPGVAVI